MRQMSSGYMAWAKMHRLARLELTGSGAPPVSSADLGLSRMEVEFEARGPYGDAEMIQAIADVRRVSQAWVMPVPGTSTANLLALASVTQSQDTERPLYDPLMRVPRLLGLEVESFERRSCPGYPLDLDAVRIGLKRGATAVCLTNLHNPSGQLCPVGDLTELVRLTEEYGAHLIVDEVYLDYAKVNGELETSRVAGIADHVLGTDSLTKVYGLGPIRAGWLVAHPRVLEQARHVVDLMHVNYPVVSGLVAV